MSACTLALLEVEREIQKALPGVVLVDRMRGPDRFLVGLAPTERETLHDVDGFARGETGDAAADVRRPMRVLHRSAGGMSDHRSNRGDRLLRIRFLVLVLALIAWAMGWVG